MDYLQIGGSENENSHDCRKKDSEEMNRILAYRLLEPAFELLSIEFRQILGIEKNLIGIERSR